LICIKAFRYCGDPSSTLGAVGRAGWLDAAARSSMVTAMPDCRLVVVPGIGHSMNLELPALYAGYFGAWFGGLARGPIHSS
jgi:pimeloyl-ACP methyl ester carboxylesterase